MNNRNLLRRNLALLHPRRGRRGFAIAILIALQIGIAHAAPSDPDVLALHDRLLTLDSHLDTPLRVALPGFDIRRRHDPHKDYSHIDLPRIREGKLDGGFIANSERQLPLVLLRVSFELSWWDVCSAHRNDTEPHRSSGPIKPERNFYRHAGPLQHNLVGGEILGNFGSG